MKGQTKERWQMLCEQAVDEQDPERFMELITELNRILSAKEERLKLNRLLSGKQERLKSAERSLEDCLQSSLTRNNPRQF